MINHQFDKAFLVVFAVFFLLWELLKPARRKKLSVSKLDLVAVINVFAFSMLTKWILTPSINLAEYALFKDLNPYLKYPLAIVVVDFSLYWVHVWSHKRILWNTHRFHHSVKEMDILKGAYTSGAHIAMYVTPQLLIAYALFGFTTFEMLTAVAFGYFVQLWQHANITVPIGFLKYIFVTPQSHRLHHALNCVRDKNFGAVFSTWDYLFGTAAESTDESYELGVKEDFKLFRGLIGY